MTLDELYSLSPIELDAILSVYYKDDRERKEWDRLQTFILFNAQGGSEKVKTPKDLITFPWDEDEEVDVPQNIDWEEYDRKYIRG